jgi:putative ABC transport system permease protein
MFRREWRQQVLVLTLLTFTVMAAIFAVVAGYHATSTSDADYGTASRRLRLPVEDVGTAERQLSEIEDWFGTTETIRSRSVRAPGIKEPIELRSQDPDGRYSGPMLDLVEGRYPKGEDETALTSSIAELLRADVGSTVELDGAGRKVVGLVENPSDLDDGFALLQTSGPQRGDVITVLMDTIDEQTSALPASATPPGVGVDRRPECHAVVCLSSSQSEQTTAAAGVLALVTVAMLLVALVASAGFVVVAQRRLRQLGMLAAIGATGRHLRMVVLANGAVVGAVAAAVGTALALSVWLVAAPALEGPSGHRIDRYELPFPLIAAGMLLATLTAVAAAWSPARSISRVPITAALSARPSRPKPLHRSAVLGGLFLVGGAVAVAAGVDPTGDDVVPVALIGGTIALVLALITLSPVVIGALARAGARAPVAVRLALRDMARYRARSGSALAAISLGLAIPIAVVIVSTAAVHGADEGNLSDRQLMVGIGDYEKFLLPERTPDEVAALEAQVDRMAETLDGADAVPLDVAVDALTTEQREGQVLRLVVMLGRRLPGGTIRDIGRLYVATPAVEAWLGQDLDATSGDVDVLTPHSGDIAFANVVTKTDARGDGARDDEAPELQPIETPGYSAAPNSFLTPAAIRRHGWEVKPAGWILQAEAPITADQLGAVRDLAATSGLTIEARDTQSGLGALSSGAVAVGFLLALGVLSMTVGLVRGEAAADLRVLTASGATSVTRRTLTATTAGALGGLGALLALVVAYAGLGAGYSGDLGKLDNIPVVHLGVVVLGLPLLAAAGGWILAGREPPAIARQPLA